MIFRLPALSFTLSVVAITIYLLPAKVTAALQFDRTALALGEWWRLVTCHLTHFSANHLTWDVGVLLALGAVTESESRRRTAGALGMAGIAISITVWNWQPQFETYRGLSGLDCALFGLFAASLLRQPNQGAKIIGAVALLAVAAKCAFELATGSTAFASGDGYAPVPLAHLVGLASGIATRLCSGRCCWSPSPFRDQTRRLGNRRSLQ